MTDETSITTEPATPPVGERRRALRAERGDEVERRVSGAASPPALVRPYARVAMSPNVADSPPPGVSGLGDGVADAPEEHRPATDSEMPGRPAPDAVAAGPDAVAAEPVVVSGPDTAVLEPAADPMPGAAVDLVPGSAHDVVAEREEPARAVPGDDVPRRRGLDALDGEVPPDETPPAPPPAPPETAPPGWSAFTPVIAPDPPRYDDAPPRPDGWEHVSVREGDDAAWLRTLRTHSDVAPDVGPDGDPDVERDDEPDVEPDVEAGPAPAAEAGAEADVPAEPTAAGPAAAGLPDARDVPDDEPDVQVEPAPAASVTGSGAVRTPDIPAEELDAAGHEEPVRGTLEPVRGTLEPVLRRSTQRTKYPTATAPVIRPPVLPPTPGDPVRPAPDDVVTWEQAVAGNVVPGAKRRRLGRRAAKARHESGGAGEYRPRAAPDRSLTLLVVGMLLVLMALVAVAVWAFWPRVTGARSMPATSSAGPMQPGRG